jgi:Ran GTPase-activating protein (RanGAP) involved in mRNA processing and transport
MSGNRLDDMESVDLLRGILRSNNAITTLDLSGNLFGRTAGAIDCIVEGLGSNPALQKIDLSHCCLRDAQLSILAQTFGSRNTTLQKLTLGMNIITSTGIGVLLETISHITDLDLQQKNIRNEEANLLARFWEVTRCRSSLASLFLVAISMMMGS